MRKTGQMVKDNTIGQTETTIKEASWMDWDMEKGISSKEKQKSSIQVSTKTIKSVDMER